jgi:hypothetical protein
LFWGCTALSRTPWLDRRIARRPLRLPRNHDNAANGPTTTKKGASSSIRALAVFPQPSRLKLQ